MHLVAFGRCVCALCGVYWCGGVGVGVGADALSSVQCALVCVCALVSSKAAAHFLWIGEDSDHHQQQHDDDDSVNLIFKSIATISFVSRLFHTEAHLHLPNASFILIIIGRKEGGNGQSLRMGLDSLSRRCSPLSTYPHPHPHHPHHHQYHHHHTHHQKYYYCSP